MKDNIFERVLELYEKEISKNVKSKRKVYNFEKYKMQNISEIVKAIDNNNFKINKYNIFLITEPKHRIVMSLNVKDKIINHYVARYVLETNLTKYLSSKNVATRKEMGADYGIKLIKKYLELNKKYNNIYALKIDISKYFYSIDHDVLLKMLKDKLSVDEYNCLEVIIKSTNDPNINCKIKLIKEYYLKVHPDLEKEVNSLPYYSYKKGLPIGNMTSQFLSIFYLYELDHYIEHTLKLKYYVRYMDDFVIISNDIDKLKKSLKEINNILENKYKLKLNIKKTKIINVKSGFSFLGYTFKVINKKTVINITSGAFNNIKKNIKKTYYFYENNIIDYNAAFSSIMSYWSNKKYGSQMKVRRSIESYWFDKFNGI